MTGPSKTLALFFASIILLAACDRPEQADPKQVETTAKQPTPADVELVPREVFFGNPSRIQGRVSPDGTKMSFMAPLDGVLNLWVGPLGDFDVARPVTRDTESGIDSHQWAANGRNVLYIRDTGGDEDFHIYSVDLETGETVDLTPFENTRGTFVGASYRYPDEYLLGINNRDPRWHDVWRVNVRNGDRELVEQHDRFGALVADLDLEVRLALEPTADGGQMVFKRGPDGEWVEFFKIEKEDVLTSAPLGFNEDGTGFYMLDSSGRDKTALILVDYESDERTIIAESAIADINEVISDPRTNEPLAYAINHQRKEWFGLTEEAQEILAHLQERLNGDVSVLAQTQDNRIWTVISDAPRDPLTYFAYDRESGAVDKLFVSRPELTGKPLSEMHALSIPSRDGLELVSYLTLPPNVDADGDLQGS